MQFHNFSANDGPRVYITFGFSLVQNNHALLKAGLRSLAAPNDRPQSTSSRRKFHLRDFHREFPRDLRSPRRHLERTFAIASFARNKLWDTRHQLKRKWSRPIFAYMDQSIEIIVFITRIKSNLLEEKNEIYPRADKPVTSHERFLLSINI